MLKHGRLSKQGNFFIKTKKKKENPERKTKLYSLMYIRQDRCRDIENTHDTMKRLISVSLVLFCVGYAKSCRCDGVPTNGCRSEYCN